MERVLRDYITLALDQLEEDEVILQGPDGPVKLIMDTKEYGDPDNPDEDRPVVQHKRIYGEVAGVPLGLSDLKLGIVDVGLPRPKRYVGHDFIQIMKMVQPKEWGVRDYSCGGFEPEFRRMSDLKLNVRQGDRVYVHYDALIPEFFLSNFTVDGKTYHMYRVRFDSVICTIQKGEIVMCAEHILIKPIMDVQKTESGIYLTPGEKPKYLEGTVAHVDPENKYHLKPGDHIFYDTDSEWENTIEGEVYYTMRERDIMINNKKPVGNRVLLDFPEAPEKTESGIIIPADSQKRLRPNRSIIRAIGDEASSKFKIGDEVHYAPGAGMEIEIDGISYWIIRDTDILLCNGTIS